MNEILKKIALAKLNFEEATPITGGDINDAFRLEKDGKYYFLKLNIADSLPKLFENEANNLKKLAEVKKIKIPKVLDFGVSEDNFQFLILEWIEKTEASDLSWKNLALDLAKIHRQTNSNFGWQEDNYLGILLQPNSVRSTWQEFYSENRLLPLAKLLRDQEILSNKEISQLENICKKLETIFPEEAPTLLHGDLWNGNILPTENNQIAFIDPASYYGHREMDLAMTKLFSGFDQTFYDTYLEDFPLEKKWEDRLPIAQLYPLMFHALVFKGYYINEVQNILKNFKN